MCPSGRTWGMSIIDSEIDQTWVDKPWKIWVLQSLSCNIWFTIFEPQPGFKEPVMQHLTIYIIRVTLNTESDPFSLWPHHAQMAESELLTLVCPLDKVFIWFLYGLDKVFTLSFFWLMHFLLSSNKKEKGVFLMFSMKRHTVCYIFA